MSEAPTITTDNPGRIGPGRLILVVGPSGAGKDTLLNMARATLAGDRNIIFPKRVVTREASPAEDNRELDRESFREALAQGEFAVHWEAHGHCYALPRHIDDDIRAGCTVVVNVSRTVVEAMRRTYAEVVVVEVTAPPDVLAGRLAMRARSSDGAVELRLHRDVDAARSDITIVNVGSVEYHAEHLVRAIKGEPQDR